LVELNRLEAFGAHKHVDATNGFKELLDPARGGGHHRSGVRTQEGANRPADGSPAATIGSHNAKPSTGSA